MKSSKNKIIFLLIALVIYLMWMTILIISLHTGYLKALIALLVLTRDILETCIDVLGFEAPERM